MRVSAALAPTMLTRLRLGLPPLPLLRPSLAPRLQTVAALRCFSSSSSTTAGQNLPEVTSSWSSFAKAAEYGCAFVDKTQFIRPILSDGLKLLSPFPRSFGKSWFVQMLDEARQGRYELFRVRVLSRWVLVVFWLLDLVGACLFSDAPSCSSRFPAAVESPTPALSPLFLAPQSYRTPHSDASTLCTAALRRKSSARTWKDPCCS